MTHRTGHPEAQRPVQRLVQSSGFQRLVIACILLAGILAGVETNQSLVARHGALLRTLDYIVLAFFAVEIGLRLAAYSPRPLRFFADGWNVLDFGIVLLCLLPMESQFAAVFRLARALRLLRLITAVPKLQLLVGALLKSLGAMGYVGLLLSLLFYIYGVAGVHLFSAASPAHFGTLGDTLLTLFKLITLDNWSEIHSAVATQAPIGAVLYFVSFILLGTMIMLNLFIGIVMNSMAEMHAEIERQNQKSAEQNLQRPLDQDLQALEEQLKTLHRQTRDLRGRLAMTAARTPTDTGHPNGSDPRPPTMAAGIPA